MMTAPRRRRTAASALTILLGLAALTAPAAAQPPDDLALELAVPGLVNAVAVRHAGDGSGRLFIVEQPGRVLVWNGVDAPATFLDVTGLVAPGGERGLLGLDFHPDYAGNGFFYVNYTRDAAPGRTVVARYSVSAGDPDLADEGSALVILEIDQDFANHNGGNLLFGPDGYLWVGMGDGGGGGDPNNRAQDLGSLLGKMLRLDVDGDDFPADPDRNYAVPPDNPFVGAAGRDEIWSLGLRNPWRWSFDRLTGDLFLGDVGQGSWEEIDFEPAGGPGGVNYGWDCREGLEPYPGGSSCTDPVDPILVYPIAHPLPECAVTGGYRYRGSGIVGLQGTYLYADFCTGTIWLATEDADGGWSSSPWQGQNAFFNVTSFGEDERGEIYVVGRSVLHRLVSPSSIFTDGFESGDVSSWSSGP